MDAVCGVSDVKRLIKASIRLIPASVVWVVTRDHFGNLGIDLTCKSALWDTAVRPPQPALGGSRVPTKVPYKVCVCLVEVIGGVARFSRRGGTKVHSIGATSCPVPSIVRVV